MDTTTKFRVGQITRGVQDDLASATIIIEWKAAIGVPLTIHREIERRVNQAIESAMPNVREIVEALNKHQADN